MIKIVVSVIAFIYSISMFSQLERIEPPHWWIGFEDSSLQLLIKGDQISSALPEIRYQGVSIQNVQKGESPNYLFIDLNINSDTKPGNFEIVFNKSSFFDLNPKIVFFKYIKDLL